MYSLCLSISVFLLFFCILGLYLWNREQNWWLPSFNIERLSSILPLDIVLSDSCTVACLDGTLVKVLSIKVMDYSILPDKKIKELERRRQAWLDKMSEENVNVRIFTFRDKKRVNLSGKFPNDILQKIHDTWMQNFGEIFSNTNFIVLSMPPKRQGIKKISPHIGKLNNLVDITRDMLCDFNPLVLFNKDISSSLLSFWARVSSFSAITLAAGENDISQRIAVSEVEFHTNEGVIVVDKGGANQHIQAICILTWGEICDKKLLEEVMRLPIEMTIVHHCHGQSTLQALAPNKLPHQAKQARMTLGGAASFAEYTEVIDELKAGKATLYEYQLTIFVKECSTSKCLESIGAIKKIFHQYGVEPRKATISLKWLYLSMFPSNEQQVYTSRLLSYSLAHWVDFHGEVTGEPHSDWGDGPIRYFKTASQNAYALQLHSSKEKESLAHSLVLAPSGSGKTMLFQHLIGGAMRHNISSYIFDRLDGTRIFTESTGGEYVSLDNKLNPFCCDDSSENRAFLYHLLLMMADANDDTSFCIARNAVDDMFALPKEKRILTNLIDIVFANSKLKQGLIPWVGAAPFGRWFNGVTVDGGATDALDITNNHLVSFDMTEVQKYPQVAACVTFYIMHRIRQELKNNAKPHLIFIDEAKPQLQNDHFCKYVSSMFLEHRKIRGSVNICFQDVNSLMENKLGNIILEQCPTKFIFPNHSASKEHMKILGLNDFEWAYVTGNLSVSKTLVRSVLVKKHNESVILDIDMQGMGSLLKLYKSGSESVKLAKEMQQTFKGVKWVENYLVM